MKSILTLVLCVVLSACSTVTVKPDGTVAIRGDVQGVEYQRHADGSATLVVASANISEPITAFWKGITPSVMGFTAAAMMKYSTDVVDAVRQPVR